MDRVSVNAESLALATYNVENYLLRSVQGRKVKPSYARLAVQDALRAMRADIVVLQEIGSLDALQDLNQALEKDALHYPFQVFSETPESPIHLGMLSRHPVSKVTHHATNVFVLYGKAYRPSRAFLEVDVSLPGGRTLKIMAAHLKSKRPVGYADQWDLRNREAWLLRQLIEQRMKESPDALLAVVGDFNDGPSSRTLRRILGPPGSFRLTDARPAEGVPGKPRRLMVGDKRRVAVWTHFFATEDVFSRNDYVLMNRPLSRHFQRDRSFVLHLPQWGQASDHRPVVAVFEF